MEYENASDRYYEKKDKLKLKLGSRMTGDETSSTLEVTYGHDREANKANAKAHVFQFGREHGTFKVESRILGAEFGYSIGSDIDSPGKEEGLHGGEVRARATFADLQAGPFNVHAGLGVSTALKYKDRVTEAKVLGCGFKVGKKIGISVFDNEFSFDVGSILGNAWPFGN